MSTSAELKAPRGCTVRVDGAPSFSSLVDDRDLQNSKIHLEVGRTKNCNKNPVAEKAIQELEFELKREYPNGQKITSHGLAIVTARLNMRIRNRGLSAKEIVFQHDGYTGDQLNINDKILADKQHTIRISNHLPSAHSQATVKQKAKIGDLVYMKSDGDKHTARDKYIVSAVNTDHLLAKRLVGSQFRNKSYKLKFSEVYPVPMKCDPTIIYPYLSIHYPCDVPHYTDSSSSSDEQESVQPLANIHPAAAENIPVSQPYSSHDSGDQESPSEFTDTQDTDSNNPVYGTHRSKRQVREPRYLRDYTSSFTSDEDD